jgi:hypothetical protein
MDGMLCAKTPQTRWAPYRWRGAVLALLALLAMLVIGASPAQEPESRPGSPPPEANPPKPASPNTAAQAAAPHPGLPPPEAITACASKLSGAPCYFREGYQTITGTCETKTGQLVCVPDRPPPGPPGEAGESTSRRGEDGLGDIAPGGPPRGQGPGSSSQRSKDRPPPPPGAGPRPPPAAFEACALGSEGSGCVVQTPKGKIAGACGLYEGRLACIPARPRD